MEGVGLTNNCTIAFHDKFGIYHSRVERVFVFPREIIKTVQLLIIIIKHVLLVSVVSLYLVRINILCLKLNISNNEVPERCINIQPSKSNIATFTVPDKGKYMFVTCLRCVYIKL